MKNVSSGGSQILGGLRLAQALPPHPSPLPWGEGEPFAALRRIERSTLVPRLTAAHPLPEGEGWGEGEGDFESTVTHHSGDASHFGRDQKAIIGHGGVKAKTISCGGLPVINEIELAQS